MTPEGCQIELYRRNTVAANPSGSVDPRYALAGGVGRFERPQPPANRYDPFGVDGRLLPRMFFCKSPPTESNGSFPVLNLEPAAMRLAG
jgi:hypothetical protein